MKKTLNFISFLVVICMLVGTFSSCDKVAENKLPDYEPAQFEIAGLWAPRDITEEAFEQYKQAGFNVVSFTNHDEVPRSSENQYYIGSKRTMQALELCKKVGLNVYLNYGNTWFVRDIEGQDYFDGTPFTNYDFYGEYKDIIKGMHIIDEPKSDELDKVATETLINDFKKVYPNAKYIINLIPIYGASSYGFTTNENMLNVFGEKVMSKFDVPCISVDIYPFHTKVTDADLYLPTNHEMIAQAAKKYGAQKAFIVQASTGNEFEATLSEGDMRWQVYNALAFGADMIQYYCYSVPDESKYNYCMLQPDNKTPSELYYHVQKINNEIQAFASAMLAYDWDMSIGVEGTDETTFRLSGLMFDENYDTRTMKETTHYIDTTAKLDLLVSRFTSEVYGEAYMFLNWAERGEETNTVTATFKDCSAVAIYGGVGYAGTPKIINLDENGNVTIELEYGEGVFVTPIAK